MFNRNPPSRSNIRQWVIKFSDTGSLKKSKRPGRPLKPYLKIFLVQELQAALERSPTIH